jgi:hypothetical protein
MNPLDFPEWGSPEPWRTTAASVPSLQLEDPVDPSGVTIKIIGDLNQTPIHSVPYDTRNSLSQYLAVLGLKRYAIYRAVYDLTNLSKGRVRMSYVPASGAVIVIGPPSFSPSSLLLNKADPPVRKETEPPKRVEEISLRYNRPKTVSEASLKPKQPAEQV